MYYSLPRNSILERSHTAFKSIGTHYTTALMKTTEGLVAT